MMKQLLLTASIFTSLSIFADQCQWNKPSDADSARKLIQAQKDIIYWCQPCGEKRPTSILKNVRVTTKAIKDFQHKATPFRSVIINAGPKEEEIDLAYTYVRTASDVFANVAQLVGCPSSGVTTFIQTTNKGNKKLAHYYDGQGERQAVLTLDQETTLIDRAPGSVATP